MSPSPACPLFVSTKTIWLLLCVICVNLQLQVVSAFAAGFGTITTKTNGSVIRATINNPPINLFDYKLGTDMISFLNSLRNTTSPPKVVIFDSANPDFFLGHFDLTAFLPSATPQEAATANLYVDTTRLLSNITTTVFIGEVNGRAFGAGNEVLMQMDMRFAGPNAKMGSLEVALGLTHGAGGLAFMTRLIGRGRASQYLFSGNTIDGERAAAIDWVNEYYSSAGSLTEAVDTLAQRIALFPTQGINATKVGLNRAGPSLDELNADLNDIVNLAQTAQAQVLIQKFLTLSNNQTLDAFELGLDDSLSELYQ